MATVVGPSRIILIKSGKFEHADVELHHSVHLVGPNNVGKTSLVAALQFLYVDDQRALHFSKPLAESRRYYFPDHYSHILFECLTPTGYRVVGVRGLGPLRQHDFERFTYEGEYDDADFIDEERTPREPEAVKLRLAHRGYTTLEPTHLRAALTGVGDARGVHLGLVPLRHKGQYEHFRKVFQNLLRLSHLKQEDVKKLLIEANQGDFHRIELDLSTDHKAHYRRVTDQRDAIKQLDAVVPEIEKALDVATRRDVLRRDLPLLWRRIVDGYRRATHDFQRQQIELDARRKGLVEERDRIAGELRALQVTRDGHVAREAGARSDLARLEKLREEFANFQADWVEVELRRLGQESDELTHRIRSAAKAQRPNVERDLRQVRQQNERQNARLANAADLVGVHLRRHLDDDTLRRAFTLLDPELLGLPRVSATGDPRPGVLVRDEAAILEHLRSLAARTSGRRYDDGAIAVDAAPLRAPDLDEYTDPDALRSELDGTTRRLDELEALLRSIDEREELEKQRALIDRQKRAHDDNLRRYGEWLAGMDRLSSLRATIDECTRGITTVESEQKRLGERREQIGAELQQLEAGARADIAGKDALDRQMHHLEPPPDETFDAVATAGDDDGKSLDALMARYATEQPEAARSSERLVELLTVIEERTAGAYVGADEPATLARLHDEVAGLEERRGAVEQLWKGLIVQVRVALKRLLQDLDTLKNKLAALNRQLGSIAVSNLERIHLELVEEATVVAPLRKIVQGDEEPLFANPRDVDAALERIGRLLTERPQLKLLDLFGVRFVVTGADGAEKRYDDLEQIESNGTTITIKVVVNLMLLKSLLGDREVRVPFYLDEVASLDAANLAAIVELARTTGFVAVLASPEARDIADTIYYLNDVKGRITLDPRRDRVRVDHNAGAR